MAPSHYDPSSALNTRAIHAGVRPDPVTGAILTPVYQSTTYAQPYVGGDKGFTYSRTNNPTVATLERAIGELEGDARAVAFGTGMAAITTLALTLLRSGAEIVVSDVVYGGTVRLLRNVLERFGVEAVFVDTSDLEAVAAAVGSRTELILVESPANPTLKLTDLGGVGEIARRAGVPLAVDNTFLTPVLQRPFDLGADIVIHSTTKYIEGHNASLGGVLVTRDQELSERFAFARGALGNIQTPWQSWITLRGLKTLPLRMQRHSDSAARVAAWLEADPRIATVSYPWLESFPQFELACRQQSGGGGIVSFEVHGGAAAGRALMASVRLCTLAENLGAAESLVTHPATMTHASLTDAERESLGITDGLVRLSVGLEAAEDIIADLDRALEEAVTSSSTVVAEVRR